MAAWSTVSVTIQRGVAAALRGSITLTSSRACGNAHGAIADFRKHVRVDGVTVVATKEAAQSAVRELQRLRQRPHAWDTETAGIELGRTKGEHSPVCHGQIVCATCYCGEDADFGSGPKLFVDNTGPDGELLTQYFKPYFEDHTFQKVFHNYSFDRHMLARHGIRLSGFYADTLHLARLFDSSRSSWEGAARKRQQEPVVAKTPDRRWTHHFPATPDSAVRLQRPSLIASKILGASLGGIKLENRFFSSTIELDAKLRIDESSVSRDGLKMSYGLKSLAQDFGLTGGQPMPEFGRLFGIHSDAARAVHDCPERFPEWVDYATMDAVLTWRLLCYLKEHLEERPWFSPVHEEDISQALMNAKVRSELLKPKCSMAGRNTRRRPLISFSSAQHDTGRNMWDFYALYIRDLGQCLADLEELGVAVDREHLERIKEAATADVGASHAGFGSCLGSIKRPDGSSFNPDADSINAGSSTQLQILLFGGAVNHKDKTKELETSKVCTAKVGAGTAKTFSVTSLGLQPSKKQKDYSPLGWPRTSAEIIRRLAGKPLEKEHGEAYEQLLQNGYGAEEAEKACMGLYHLSQARSNRITLSGFVDPFLRFSRADGRIHPAWQWDTSTGRLACRSPNLQNLPRLNQDKYQLRAALVPSPGNLFVIADYSQLELRVLAHVARCQSMVEKFSRGGDYHSEVAAEMFPYVQDALRRGDVMMNKGVGTGNVTDIPTVQEKFTTERSKAKAINFGIVYGKTAKSLKEDLGLSTEEEAEDLMKQWHRPKPEIREWSEAVKQEAHATGRATSILGRWRQLPLIKDPKFRSRSERAAVNFGIQGSSADIVVGAMLQLWRHQALLHMGFRIVMQIHDEFVLEGPAQHANAAKELVREVMMNPFQNCNPGFKMAVPLVTDVKVGSSFS